MAIYRLSLSTMSRSAGRSAVAAAAYRAGQQLHDERTGQVADYRRRHEIRHCEMIGWTSDREALWNAAERAERRRDSVVAREVQLALPEEISEAARTTLAVDFGRWLHARYGVAVDVAVHGPGKRSDDRNQHAHLLFTTRTVDAAGTFGAKTRLLDVQRTGSVEIERMRAEWAERVNDALAAAGVAAHVDHRSYVRQAVRRESEHLGRAAIALEDRGEATEKGAERRARRARNAIAAVSPRMRPARRSRFNAGADVEAEQGIDYATPEVLADVATMPPVPAGRVTAIAEGEDVLVGVQERRVGAPPPTPKSTTRPFPPGRTHRQA